MRTMDDGSGVTTGLPVTWKKKFAGGLMGMNLLPGGFAEFTFETLAYLPTPRRTPWSSVISGEVSRVVTKAPPNGDVLAKVKK
jgi:hypothetical protein